MKLRTAIKVIRKMLAHPPFDHRPLTQRRAYLRISPDQWGKMLFKSHEEFVARLNAEREKRLRRARQD